MILVNQDWCHYFGDSILGSAKI